MICGVLFSISSVADNLMGPKFFHVAFFYSGLIIQLYSNCFYGSQVFVAVRQKKNGIKFDILIEILNQNSRAKIFVSMHISPIGRRQESIQRKFEKLCQ